MTQPPVGVPTCYRHPDRETYISCQRCGKSICPDCMRDAAVGFQCPDCVAEGAKATRQGRTAYGGRRPKNPGLTSMTLIAMNAAVWAAVIVTGWRNSELVSRLALIPTGQCEVRGEPGAYWTDIRERAVCDQAQQTWVPGVADGAVWQLLTSAFTHIEPWHIGFNMLALWFLGPQLELVLGRARFLALYLISALAGSTAVLWLSGETTATLGASGAIFGLIGALLVVAHKVGGDVQGILFWLAINAVITFVVPNVSWQGHLGGLVGGALVAAVLVYAPRERRTAVQAAGLVALAAVLGAAVVARTLVLAA